MKINVLPTEIANMIAAGEVVERPASVIKELLENSIDAGATSVTVEIKKGGVPYMRITDNGCGIAKEEIETAFKRHATSKIKTASDLDDIGTLGFRGEALASIAAVAEVELFTKTKDSANGSFVTVVAGEVKERGEAGTPDGTTIIVRNLFFNTPARMKFLKSDSAETSYITDVMNKLALSHPEVAFQYINSGKTVLSTRGDGNLLNTIHSIWGSDYSKNMTEISFSEDGFSVRGYVGKAVISRKDRRHQFFFVNSRNIMSKIMSSAVSEAFKSTVMTGHFPVCVLKVSLSPKDVDVNVHPAKTEVRFADEKKVYSSIYWAVKNALSQEKFVPEIRTAKAEPIKNAPSYEEAKQTQIDFYKAEKEEKIDTRQFMAAPPGEETPSLLQKPKEEAIAKDQASKEDLSRFVHERKYEPNEVRRKIPQDYTHLREVTEEELKAEEKLPLPAVDVDFKYVGQVFGTYFILQKDNEMLIIDQHAAHERICYEELLDSFKANEVHSQLMLLPVTINLSPREMDIVERADCFFEQLGFSIEPFGGNTVIVRATPGTLTEDDIKEVISDIITMISGNVEDIVKSLYEEALYMVACKSALKGNKVLSESELKVLGAKVLSLGEGINTCPHGRPIMMKMTKYNLEKQFKRE